MKILIGQVHGTDNNISPGQTVVTLHIGNKVMAPDNVHTFDVEAKALPDFNNLTADAADTDDQQIFAKSFQTG